MIPRQLAKRVLPVAAAALNWREALRAIRRERVTVMTCGVGAGLRFAAGLGSADSASGEYELPVQTALADALVPGAVMYDVGANVGFFTVLAARLVGPAGRVIAFEPEACNAEYVRLNARLNRFAHVAVVEKAVSAASGRGELWLAGYAGGHALRTADKPPDAVDLREVETISLDEFVASAAAPPPTLVKIDVEGAELDVLLGMSHVLRDVRPVVIYEVDDEDLARVRRKQEAVDAYLRGHGYSISRIEGAYHLSSWHVGHGLALPEGTASSG